MIDKIQLDVFFSSNSNRLFWTQQKYIQYLYDYSNCKMNWMNHLYEVNPTSKEI